MKNTLRYRIVNHHKKTTFDEKKKFEECKIASVNLEKTVEYLKIQGGWQSENLAEFYLCNEIFLYVFLCLERYYTDTK